MPKTHRHLIFNGVVRNTPTDPSACRQWLDALVPRIHMKTLVPASSVYCDEPGNEGITGFVVISTSHAASHYWEPRSEQPRRLSFCLYSCADFAPAVVIDHIDAFWSIERCRHRLIDRTWDILEVDDVPATRLTDRVAPALIP